MFHFSFKTVDNKVIENDGNHQEMNNTISFENGDVSTDMMTETAWDLELGDSKFLLVHISIGHN